MQGNGIAAVIQEGQNGPKWFVTLYPADELYANIYSGKHIVGHISFYILPEEGVLNIRVSNVQLSNLEWFQNALEFLKSFSK